MAISYYEFEKPVQQAQDKLDKALAKDRQDEKHLREIQKLETELEQARHEIYGNLTPFQRVLIARKPERPHAQDYIKALTTEFQEIHGDRGYADDKAVLCGFAQFRGVSCVVIGQCKGREVKENLKYNFGMMHPEGYRKALRTMKLADKFGLPVLVFIDTPGAYPGVQAEERGQFEAIARNIREMFTFTVPVLCSVIGEGASGGAIGIGVGNVVLMLENAWYSVISPEGCASILWRDAQFAPQAAEALKLTAQDLLELKIVEEIVPEPLGGAHYDPDTAYANLGDAMQRQLTQLLKLSPDELREQRFAKYRAVGEWEENLAEQTKG
ncbi:acetyl-CoA carboxylase carboxyltransferase subunit alpha [Candidatus Sumerlaeota bacterium]|nr:acetyl-CoA carboxylase carboxyltransferase subunit alpha [Candidatus Sumerlaeota bacterium]